MVHDLSYEQLQQQVEELRSQLEEATDTIEAIRTGQIDALVLKNGDGHQLYTLKSADQTYRVFIEKMNEGAITLNRDGLILYSNSRFAKMVATDLSKVVGMDFIDLIADDQKEAFQKNIDHAWSEDIKGEVLLKKDGHGNTAFLFSINPLELDEGMALSLTFADLSQQKESERLLKEKNSELEQAQKIAVDLNNELERKVQERTAELSLSRQHFKFMADNIPVMAWTASPDGKITYFNKRWYEYTGMQENELMQEWSGVIHPNEAAAAKEAWQTAVQTTQPYRIEYRIKRAADGAYRWHYGNALPYKNDAGQVIAWFGVSSDIDFQKKAIEQKDDFINMVSHELKTPVTSLKGFTQLLMMTIAEKDGEAEVISSYLASMNNQITKLTRLITDLLDATRFNNGTLQYDNDIFELNTLTKEITHELELTAGTHKIALRLSDPVNLSGDRNRIGQVITNLISNAIKYSPNSVDVIVSTTIKNNELIFCVKDFGIGISKEQQPNLYTRFFRATQQNSENNFPGMGLGLYISLGIIEKHAGKMWVKSDTNKGSEFYFSLPLYNG